MTPDQERGRDLEAAIDAYFSMRGYQTTRNAILSGRSGGRHEIDILAVKDDGVTTVRLMVECKAWALPIDKEVVAKASYEAADCALQKVVIVTLGGASSGARTSADELGIDIWDADEVRARLGEVALARLNGRPPAAADVCITEVVSIERASAAVRKLKSREESMPEPALVWLPAVEFSLSYTHETGGGRFRFSKRRSTSSVVHLYCEALTGMPFWRNDAPLATGARVATPRLQPRVKPGAVEKSLLAVSRRRALEETLGLQRETTISVAGARPVFFPVVAAALTHREQVRFAVADCLTGAAAPELAEVLTGLARQVREELGLA